MRANSLQVAVVLIGWTACLILTSAAIPPSSLAAQCEPTKRDAMGPFYKPNAPVRSSVGHGYVLSGQVKSSRDCSPLVGARIEFWLAGPNGRYDDDHRATIFAGKDGRYRFESNFPPSYFARPPHIHIRVSAQAYGVLVTQHYPNPGQPAGTFDLVLIPAP